MKHPLWQIGAGGVLCVGLGFLLGRTNPPHHYQQFGQSKYLIDTTTGVLCMPFPEGPNLTALDTFRVAAGLAPQDPPPNDPATIVPRCGAK